MKNVTLQELAAVELVPMTRAAKLHHWAALIRGANWPMQMFYDLEAYSLPELQRFPIHDSHNIFSIATKDPVFQSAGLPGTADLSEVTRFMELSRHELHIFGCGCHGALPKEEIARRIDNLAEQQR